MNTETQRLGGREVRRNFWWWIVPIILVAGLLIFTVLLQRPDSSAEAFGQGADPTESTVPVAMPQPSATVRAIAPSPTPASAPPVAAPTLELEPAAPQPTAAAPLTEVEFTLRTAYEAGRMLYVGVGGDIDGVVNPDLIVTPGTIVRAILVNDDGIPHDLFFPDFGAQTAAIGRKGQTAEVTFTVDQGTGGEFVYYCTMPGHRQAGQEGWFVVKQDQ